jgi:hypothetical protein
MQHPYFEPVWAARRAAGGQVYGLTGPPPALAQGQHQQQQQQPQPQQQQLNQQPQPQQLPRQAAVAAG